VDVAVEGEPRLAGLDEAPDRDAADVRVDGRVVDRPPVERRAVESRPVGRRVEEDGARHVVRPGERLRSPAIVPHFVSSSGTGTERCPSSGDTQPGSAKRETSYRSQSLSMKGVGGTQA
jgi:hypothetical protein